MTNLDSFWAAIIGAIVGGIITGVFALMAARQSHKNAVGLQQKKEQEAIEGLLQAVHDEVETIWDRYQEGMGVHLETLPEGQPLLFYYPVVQDYFTVYNSNAFLIGKVADHDLRKEIVSVYTLAKGLVDSYRLNNELVHKFEYWDGLFQESQNDVHKNRALTQYAALVEYAKTMRRQHDQLKEKTSKLLRMLRKNGFLTKKT